MRWHDIGARAFCFPARSMCAKPLDATDALEDRTRGRDTREAQDALCLICGRVRVIFLFRAGFEKHLNSLRKKS
jgi:hypothetical protein